MKNSFAKLMLSSLVALGATSSSIHASADVELAAGFDQSRFLTTNEIPAGIADWVYHEQLVNLRFTGTIFAPLDHSELDPRFDPFNRPVVLMGYLEIPVDKASFRVDKSLLPESAQRVLFFKKNGVEYIRHFVHPMMEEKYAPEAKLYGERYIDAQGKTRYRLKYGEFAATLSSSMRSWIVWNRKNPTDFVGEKTSIAVVVGIDRKNDLDKLERANAITQVTKEISARDRKTYGFEMMAEPLTQNTAKIKDGKTYGNITRVFPVMSHPNGKARYVPGFSLTSPDPQGGRPLLVQQIQKSGLSAEKFIAQKLVEPLVRAYAYLTFEHGIVGEPHQQNVLFELDAKGDLTGRIIFRDLDAFKPDIELRHVRELSDEPFLGAKRPFKLLKMGKAEHDYRRSFNSYVKGAWVESIENMIGLNANAVPDLASASNLAEIFDKTFLREAVRHMGFETVFDAANMAASEELEWLERQKENKDPKFGRARFDIVRDMVSEGTLATFVAQNKAKLEAILPSVNWSARPLNLTVAQTEKILDAFSVNELFLRNYKNTATTYIFDINRIVEKFKDVNVPKEQEGISQSVLRKEFERLAFNYRASTVQDIPASGRFVLNKGSITAVSSRGEIIGHAFLEPRSTLALEGDYYTDKRYPRVEPNRAVLARLYDFADGKLKSIPDIETQVYVYPEAAKEESGEETKPANAIKAPSCEMMFAR